MLERIRQLSSIRLIYSCLIIHQTLNSYKYATFSAVFWCWMLPLIPVLLSWDTLTHLSCNDTFRYGLQVLISRCWMICGWPFLNIKLGNNTPIIFIFANHSTYSKSLWFWYLHSIHNTNVIIHTSNLLVHLYTILLFAVVFSFFFLVVFH